MLNFQRDMYVPLICLPRCLLKSISDISKIVKYTHPQKHDFTFSDQYAHIDKNIFYICEQIGMMKETGKKSS